MENEFNTIQPTASDYLTGNVDAETYLKAGQQIIQEELQPQVEQLNEEEAEEEETQDPTFMSEAGAALVGGAADAVESVGGFAELTGDTLKTSFNTVFGRPIDATQNPFDSRYQANDGGWLDLPDEWIPENQTGLGKLSRGLVEFGLLTLATGGAGKAVGAVSGVGKAVGAWQTYSKGNRALQFVGTAGKVGLEGGVADLVSSSSETGNMANLLHEHTPWIAPWFTSALAVEPEDNPWLSRIKTVTAGAGLNWVGWGISSFAKGAWTAARARKAGKSVDEANDLGNQAAKEEYEQLELFHQNARNAESKQKAAEGYQGVDPDLTPERYNPSDTAFTNPSNEDLRTRHHVADAINDIKNGGEGMSYEPLLTNTAWRQITRGDKNISAYLKDVVDDLATEVFQEKGNTLNHKEVKELIVRQTYEMTKFLENGGDIAENFSKLFSRDAPNVRIYRNEGKEIVTGTPAQKAALQLTINSLMKQAQGIATGAIHIADDTTVYRQASMVFESARIALKEHKKIGYMWGLDGKQMQTGLVPESMMNNAKEAMKKIDEDVDRYVDELVRLTDEGDNEGVKALMEMHAVSRGKVTILDQLQEFFTARINGGEIDGVKVKGELRQQVQSTFYNSVLSAVTTPVKAIFGTNMIGILRPFQAYAGASIGQMMKGQAPNAREMAIAAAQIDALGKAFAEGFQMFKYTWDSGIHNKQLPYETRFDIEKDVANWKAMGQYVEKYGTDSQKIAYKGIDAVQTFNNSPWVKYSQNAMAAGDSLARTLIGRIEMRMRAATEAADEGIELSKLTDYVKNTEEKFRDTIFKKNRDGKYVVTDAATKMAGDEAAMTRALEGNMMGWEMIGRIPGMTAFFPFVRTGFNSLDLVFKHTPLEAFRTRYQDIMNGKNLEKYGLTEATLPQAKALMEGRIAMGSTIMGMATIAAMAGNMTGDYPYTKEDRDAWQMAGIQPYSFKFGNTYVSYKNLEPFNTLFAMAANMVQNGDILGESYIDNGMKKLVYMTAAVIVDKSMLSGVEDLATLMSGDTSGQNYARVAARFARSHLPYAGLSGQLGSIIDANKKEAQELTELFIKRDAISKSTLPPKYDILSKDRTGKPLVHDAQHPLLRLFNAVSPVPVVIIDGDPIREALVEMRYNLPETMNKINGVTLNAYERSQLQKYMSMGKLRSKLEKVILDNKTWRDGLDRYKANNLRISEGASLYEAQFYQIVDGIFREEKKIAVERMKREIPELGERIEARRANQQAVKTGRYELVEKLKQHGI